MKIVLAILQLCELPAVLSFPTTRHNITTIYDWAREDPEKDINFLWVTCCRFFFLYTFSKRLCDILCITAEWNHRAHSLESYEWSEQQKTFNISHTYNPITSYTVEISSCKGGSHKGCKSTSLWLLSYTIHCIKSARTCTHTSEWVRIKELHMTR